MISRRAACVALLVLKRCNDEPLVLDGDTHAGSWCEAGGLDPPSGELHPRKEGWRLAHTEGPASLLLIAPGFLDGDRPFGDGGRWCFMISLSHDQLPV